MASVHSTHSVPVNTTFIMKVFKAVIDGANAVSAVKSAINKLSMIIDGGMMEFIDFLISAVIKWVMSA